MIRPRWLPRAALGARSLSSAHNPKDPRWMVPGRKAPDGKDDRELGIPRVELDPKDDEFAKWRKPVAAPGSGLNPIEERSRLEAKNQFRKRNPEAYRMLVLQGLPTSLVSNDFLRLNAKDLASWRNLIKEVQQERDPWTLDPLGTYHISFDSSSAAELYRATLDRLLRLARIKLHCTTGLWTSEVPPELRGDGEFEAELEQFSLVPGSYPGTITSSLARVRGKWPWQHLMDLLVRRSGYRLPPTAVLLQLRHTAVSGPRLDKLIRKDGAERNHPWNVSLAYSLSRTTEDLDMLGERHMRVPVGDSNFHFKLTTRFVLLFKNSEIAWRFIRSWNQREIEVDDEGRKTTVTASYIEF
ncbi:hypothetical protein N0V84_001723 [Fusarium piperis]|uniref:Uncharacterized protein n=1 Tax=Fusarium piperis TaxID=1435070 RepID=A0A9W8WKT1_9HYPO|nr:hypothetical protein N0V84_001723 [Fusarium piperis]